MSPDLTPGERQRIYLEEKARFESANAIHQDAKQQRRNRTALGCLVAFLVVGGFVAIISVFSSSTAPTRAPEIAEGTSCYVAAAGGSAALAGSTKENFELADKSYRMGDKLGTAKMAMDGRALLIDNGTGVMVIGSSGDLYQVRIQAGPMIAREAWLPKGSVKASSR